MLEVYEEPLHRVTVLIHIADLINALDHAELALFHNIHNTLLRNIAEGAGDAKAGAVLREAGHACQCSSSSNVNPFQFIFIVTDKSLYSFSFIQNRSKLIET